MLKMNEQDQTLYDTCIVGIKEEAGEHAQFLIDYANDVADWRETERCHPMNTMYLALTMGMNATILAPLLAIGEQIGITAEGKSKFIEEIDDTLRKLILDSMKDVLGEVLDEILEGGLTSCGACDDTTCDKHPANQGDSE